MFYKLVTAAVAMSVSAAGPLLLQAPTDAATTAPTQTTPTSFALNASGYAVRVDGGSVPIASQHAAFQVLGCTNVSGLNKTNSVARVSLPGLGRLENAKTRVWTTSANNTVSSWSRDTIGRVVLGNPSVSALVVKGVVSTSRAFENPRGFHASTSTRVARILLVVAGQAPVSFPVPGRGQTLTIPGVATITLGAVTRKQDAHGALAAADALDIHYLPTDSQIVLAHSKARINDGVQSALFHGSAYGSRLTAVDGTVTSGATPYIVMPCQGTNGRVIHRDLARVGVPGGIIERGLGTSEEADQTTTNAQGFERAKVANVSLGHNVVITGLEGRASASYFVGQNVKTSIKGSTPGRVTVGGTVVRFPRHGSLRIPGVVSLTPNVVHHFNGGVEVIAVQAKLLDGSGATINFGRAKIQIVKSGL